MIETCRSDFKCFNVKFYIRAFVGFITKVILRNARCNNKDAPTCFEHCCAHHQEVKIVFYSI